MVNEELLVRQLEPIEILKSMFTYNSILVLYCSFKVSKYISECWPRFNWSKKVVFQVQF